MVQPYRKYSRKLGDPSVEIHEKREFSQNPEVGEGLLESAGSVVTPLLEKRRQTNNRN